MGRQTKFKLCQKIPHNNKYRSKQMKKLTDNDYPLYKIYLLNTQPAPVYNFVTNQKRDHYLKTHIIIQRRKYQMHLLNVSNKNSHIWANSLLKTKTG